MATLQWRHNQRDVVSNYRRLDCLLNHLFRPKSKKISKLHATGICVGNSPGTGEFPAQMASNAKNVPFDDVIMYRGLSYSFLINTKLGCQIISRCGAMINVSWSFPTRILLGFSWHFEMTCKDTLSDNSPVTGEFPAQRASNAENVSIWWRHHEESLSGASCGNMDRLRYLGICTKPTVTK